MKTSHCDAISGRHLIQWISSAGSHIAQFLLGKPQLSIVHEICGLEIVQHKQQPFGEETYPRERRSYTEQILHLGGRRTSKAVNLHQIGIKLNDLLQHSLGERAELVRGRSIYRAISELQRSSSSLSVVKPHSVSLGAAKGLNRFTDRFFAHLDAYVNGGDFSSNGSGYLFSHLLQTNQRFCFAVFDLISALHPWHVNSDTNTDQRRYALYPACQAWMLFNPIQKAFHG